MVAGRGPARGGGKGPDPETHSQESGEREGKGENQKGFLVNGHDASDSMREDAKNVCLDTGEMVHSLTYLNFPGLYCASACGHFAVFASSSETILLFCIRGDVSI